jgi:CheY-like chemotaxis protein
MVAIKDFLEDEGSEVEAVADASGVTEYGPTADVLVVDVRLPTRAMEGVTAVADLLREGLIQDHVPVIFISVLDEDDAGCQGKLKEYPFMEGRYIWIQKPFELELLVDMISEEIEARQHDV